MIRCCNSDEGLYTFPDEPPATASTFLAASPSLWNQRLGHPGPAVLATLNKQHFLPCNKVDRSLCYSCQLGKHSRVPFSTSVSTTVAPFELLPCDVWTSPVTSISGYSYYLVILDDFTHYWWTFPLRQKSEVHDHMINFVANAYTQFRLPVNCFQADNGTEFVNNATKVFLAVCGILFRLSCLYTSPQSGSAHSLQFGSDPHDSCLSSSIGNEVPFTRLYRTPLEYGHLRVFGCLCYPNLQATSPHKPAPRSTACVFLGYPSFHKGYSCLDLSICRIIISQHVVFDETVFPFASSSTAESVSSLDFLLSDDVVLVP